MNSLSSSIILLIEVVVGGGVVGEDMSGESVVGGSVVDAAPQNIITCNP